MPELEGWDIRNEDVDLYNDRMEVRIRRSKTDQLGREVRVVVFVVAGSGVCPVRCLRGLADPRLAHPNELFLSRYQFSAIFKTYLQQQGLDPSLYSEHSLSQPQRLRSRG